MTASVLWFHGLNMHRFYISYSAKAVPLALSFHLLSSLSSWYEVTLRIFAPIKVALICSSRIVVYLFRSPGSSSSYIHSLHCVIFIARFPSRLPAPLQTNIPPVTAGFERKKYHPAPSPCNHIIRCHFTVLIPPSVR